MTTYFAYFKLSLMKNLQYKTAALAGMATQLFFGMIFIFIFEAFYEMAGPQPIAFKQLVQMVWLQQSFLAFIMLWYRDSELYNMITSGQIAYELVRPSKLYPFWFSKLLGQRLASAMLRFLPILLVASFLPEPYTLVLPENPLTFLYFVLTLVLGLLVVVGISMLIYISIFYTLSPAGSFLMIAVFGEFFAGMTIPIPLMPKVLQNICFFLPFRYSGDLPFRIYAGHIEGGEIIIGIVMQILWLMILWTFGNVWMKKSLKKIVVQGG
jgi:ABC-2 type transport system permease protein